MTRITEDYCSKEIYRLLIKKGFDGEIHTTFNEEGYTQPSITLQTAMKWLREEKNILIYVYPVIDLQVKNNYTFYWRWDGKKKRHDASHIGDKHNYESFEQAVEAAVKYCLENLI